MSPRPFYALVASWSLTAVAWAQPPQGQDEAQLASAAAVSEGAIGAEQGDGMAVQVRHRLGADNVGSCQGDAACQQELRTQLRACLRTARELDAIKEPGDAAAVAAAVLRLRQGDGAAEAGELVQTQLRRGWSATAVDATAGDMERMRDNQRWQRQARAMLRACADDQSCNAEQARIALDVMRQASSRADGDARQAARAVQATLRENRAARAERGGEQLRSQLRQRLRLHASDKEGAAGSGQMRRNRYRHQMAGEGQRGGSFGGGMMQGSGSGIGPGRGGRR